MPNDLLIYLIYGLSELVGSGVLRPLGGNRYQFTRDYLHNPTFTHPTKPRLQPLRASDIWQANSGNIINIIGMESAARTVQRPGYQNYQFQFELGGFAYRGYYGTGRFLPIEPDAPTADAGSDQAVQSGAMVFLQGSGSSPDGTAVSFAWQQVSGPVVSVQQPGQSTAAFLAPIVAIATELEFQLTVTANGLSTTDVVTITIQPS